jgi:beta-mannanase
MPFCTSIGIRQTRITIAIATAHSFDPNVLVSGTATYNNFMATIASDGAKLQSINCPFIFDPMGEMNYGSSPGNYGAQGGSGITGAQFQALWIEEYNAFMAITGLSSKMLWSFEVGSGNTGWTGFYPGSAYVDLMAVHAFTGDRTTWSPDVNYTSGTLASYEKPIFVGSTGYQGGPSGGATPFGNNDYTQIAQQIAANAPLFWGYIMWGQYADGSQLAQQNGAAQAMSTAPFLNASNMPGSFTRNK